MAFVAAASRVSARMMVAAANNSSAFRTPKTATPRNESLAGLQTTPRRSLFSSPRSLVLRRRSSCLQPTHPTSYVAKRSFTRNIDPRELGSVNLLEIKQFLRQKVRFSTSFHKLRNKTYLVVYDYSYSFSLL